MQRLQVRFDAAEHSYQIKIGRGILRDIGSEVSRCLHNPARRVAIVSNRKVFALFGAQTVASLNARNYNVVHWLMGDGERFKTLSTVNKLISFLSKVGFERDDAVVALGGGVAGDTAGFAAATYLRGVPLVQVPTTLMAQIDSSVGGKTGVNLPEGKNLIGAFHQPSSVIIDPETLTTLPKRELTSGWCESVKQGAAGDRNLFEQTRTFLESSRSDRNAFSSPALEKLIAAHCGFKASIVMGDQREATQRSDQRSRRILNFGHTIGHALEAVTQYRRFRHGEAVGHGMLVAGEISKNLGLLGKSELELLQDTVRLCGPLPKAHDLNAATIVNAVSRDKKSVHGRIQWVLLERIGRATIVDAKEISVRLLRDSLRTGLQVNK